MKQIVVLGGGFAGIRAILQLQKKILTDVNLILIDQNKFHLFTPSLYEVATSEEPHGNIALPFSKIVGRHTQFINDKVESIDCKSNVVKLISGRIYKYDYLLIALGSEVSYFNIPGLKEHSYSLKTIEDALRIKNTIKHYYHKKLESGGNLNIIIGGGGFSGTELAAELVTYKNRLSFHHRKLDDLIRLSIIQGSAVLLKELDPRVSEIARKRLNNDGVKFCFGVHIKSVDAKFVYTDDGNKYVYDILIWTGGIKGNSVLEKSGLPVTKKGQIVVNDKMQPEGFANIFIAGDLADFSDSVTGEKAVNVAQVAEEEGLIAGENIYNSLLNMPLKSYRFKHFGYIIPLKGSFAVAAFKGFYISGIIGFMLQQMVFLKYLLSVFSFSDALSRWNKFEKYLRLN